MPLQALCIISYPFVNSNLSYSPDTLNSGQNRQFFEPRDREILQMTLKNNRAALLCNFKLCVSFRTRWWIQIGVTVWKHQFGSNLMIFRAVRPWNSKDDLENNRAPLLSNIKLYVSFHHHMWIQTGVTVRKLLSSVVTSVTLTFDLDLLYGPYPGSWW